MSCEYDCQGFCISNECQIVNYNQLIIKCMKTNKRRSNFRSGPRYCNQPPLRYWFETKSFVVMPYRFGSPKLTFSELGKPLDFRFGMPSQVRTDDFAFLDVDHQY